MGIQILNEETRVAVLLVVILILTATWAAGLIQQIFGTVARDCFYFATIVALLAVAVSVVV